MRHNKGFTLIEILIALTIFAIIATITSSVLYYAFNIRTRVTAEAEQLNRLQLAISLIRQDTFQAVDRAVRGNDMKLFASFIGQPKLLELTRDGNLNPQSLEKRSTLKRIALVCEGDKLVRRTWESLDVIDKNKFESRVLLTHLSECQFNYLNQTLQVLNDWRQTVSQDNQKENLPKAIQLNISLKPWGKMNLLFLIPGAVYATN